MPDAFAMTPYSFSSLIFQTNANDTFYSRVRRVDLSAQRHGRLITLPNGAVFDPYQTYKAPRSLGTFRFTVSSFANGTNGDRSIEDFYQDIRTIFLGRRSTLDAYTPDGDYVFCTARLDEIAAAWQGKKRHWGPGITVSDEDLVQLRHIDITYTFGLVTDWER